jgi:tetratricopeptide (TPR) repeat protein
MNPRLQRALLLIDQRRFDLAEKEAAAALAEEPNDAIAHGCMALCQLERKQYDEATRFAEHSIHLQSDSPFGHWAAARIWNERNFFDKAEASIREAIGLAPQDADYLAFLSHVKFNQKDWNAALKAAETALEIDPENVGALNLRAESLRKLGRTHDARSELNNALRIDPDSADTHAALGWNYLQKGERAKAAEHFREALRLNPESEWARHGVLETLRSYNPIYRPLLQFFLWMQTLGRGAQWGVIIGAYVVYRMLVALADKNPAWQPYIMPLVFLYISFAAGTWLGRPLMNLALRLHPLGRLALSRDERIASNWIGGFLAAGLTAMLINLAHPSMMGTVGMVLLLMIIPLAAMFTIREPTPRLVALVYTLLIGLCGAVFLAGVAFAPSVPDGQANRSLLHALKNLSFLGLLLGAFISPLVSNIIASIDWKK